MAQAEFEEIMADATRSISVDPLMCVNTSEQSLIKRILQTKILGLEEISAATVGAKLAEPDASMSGLNKHDSQAFRGVHKAVTQALKLNSKENWLPLIYNWEFFPCSARTIHDFGHLVYTNMELNKYLLVEIFERDPSKARNLGHGHVHYVDLIKTLTNKLFCVLKYLGAPDPEWVRASYTLADSALHPSFIENMDDPSPEASVHPPIIHINHLNFRPVLTPEDFKSIERILKLSSAGRVSAISAALEGREETLQASTSSLPYKVFGMDTGSRAFWTSLFEQQCAGCRKLVDARTLRKCGGCGMQEYCSVKCQKKQWKYHKWWCNAAQGKHPNPRIKACSAIYL